MTGITGSVFLKPIVISEPNYSSPNSSNKTVETAVERKVVAYQGTIHGIFPLIPLADFSLLLP
jgi:hypothetical protein